MKIQCLEFRVGARRQGSDRLHEIRKHKTRSGMSIHLNVTGQEMQGTGGTGTWGMMTFPTGTKVPSGKMDQWIVDS